MGPFKKKGEGGGGRGEGKLNRDETTSYSLQATSKNLLAGYTSNKMAILLKFPVKLSLRA